MNDERGPAADVLIVERLAHSGCEARNLAFCAAENHGVSLLGVDRGCPDPNV